MNQGSLPLYDAVVVGGGISGLTAAWRLHQAGSHVLLLESAPRVGGVIQTTRQQGFQAEDGPNTFLRSAHAIRELAEALSLTPCGASLDAKNRYIYRHQCLIPLPMSPGAFIRSPLLSLRGKLRLLGEPLCAARRRHGDDDDESVADLIRRRLGREVLNAVINPFLAGVYAGNPEALSARAVFPKLVQWERAHGSLLQGAIADRLASRRAGKHAAPKAKAAYEPALYSFDGGMAALPTALADALPASAILTGAPVLAIDRIAHATPPYRLTLADGRSLAARAVVLATPADTAARLLGALLPPAQQEFLATIPYAPVSVVHLGVERSAIPHALDGFGFLVPRAEGMRTLGAIWASALFPSRAPQGHALLSAFIGGMCDPELADWDDATLANAALGDVSTAFHCPQRLRPVFQSMMRWRRAVPQAEVGHPARVSALEAALDRVPGAFLAGNYLHGVSVNDCIAHATTVATRAREFLAG